MSYQKWLLNTFQRSLIIQDKGKNYGSLVLKKLVIKLVMKNGFKIDAVKLKFM